MILTEIICFMAGVIIGVIITRQLINWELYERLKNFPDFLEKFKEIVGK